MDIGANIKCMVFAWYSEIEFQNRYKEWCYGDFQSCPLIMPHNKLLPFQIKRATNSVEINDAAFVWKIINTDNGVETNLKTLLPASYTTMEIRTTGEIDYIIYYASQSFDLNLADGYYYSVITDGINTWYSEIFMISCFIDPVDIGSLINIGGDGGLIVERHPTWEDFLLADEDDVVTP